MEASHAALIGALYVAVLFALAWLGERWLSGARAQASAGLITLVYLLSFSVYNTAWSFFGSVGRAAVGGLDYMPIYLGPTLVLLFFLGAFQRIVRIAKSLNLTSISDFLSSRYGKSSAVAVVSTCVLLVAVLPYISLQLKAISASFETLTRAEASAGTQGPFWQDTAFSIALSMAVFSIIFGVKHVHASAHHRGLMAAIAFEGLFKIAAFVAVSLYIIHAGGVSVEGALVKIRAGFESQRAAFGGFDTLYWLTNTLISMIAFLCLPQTFHVMVVENEKPGHLRKAAVFYPLYLCIFSLFMAPIAAAGASLLPASVSPDSYIIAIPVALGSEGFALLAFLGGLSAATGMVIVTAVALSTMLCNDIAVPLLVKRGLSGGEAASPLPARDISGAIILLRRVILLAVIMLAYALYRLLDQRYPLTRIGLISFVAVAQIGPAFVAGLVWRRANARGAIGGILVGMLVWLYTLFLPSLADIAQTFASVIERGPWGIAALRPQALLGLSGMDPLAHASLWSLGLNTLVLVLLSLARAPRTIERIQATIFTQGPEREEGKGRGSTGIAHLKDLRSLVARFVGPQWGAAEFDQYLRARQHAGQAPPDLEAPIDLDAVRFAETLLAGAVGAASARVILSASLEGYSLSRKAALAMLDEASEALRFNRSLLQETVESVPQGICMFDHAFRVTAWNRRYIELLDLPSGFIQVGTPLERIVAFNRDRGEVSPINVLAEFAVIEPNIAPPPYIFERRRRDGMVLEVFFARLPSGGYVSTYTDVTERNRAAEALRGANETLEQRVKERTEALEQAKMQAETANLDKTKFLAAIGHDLQQPLHAARLFLTALQAEHPAAPASGARDLFAAAEGALRTSEQLLESLLEVAAMDAAVLTPAPRLIEVNEVLSPLAVEFSAMSVSKGLRLTYVPCAARVQTDPRLLRRALQNLLANALRYTRQGRILLGCRRVGGALRIEVWDTGMGVAPENAERIFHEFQRDAAGEGGLGLGLAITRKTAELIGATIALRSWPGRGSCFSLLLPPQGRAPAASAGPASRRTLDIRVAILGSEAEGVEELRLMVSRWVAACAVFAPDAAGLAEAQGHDVLLFAGAASFRQACGPQGIPPRGAIAMISTGDVPDIDASGYDNIEILTSPVKRAALRRYLNAVALKRHT
ncbi:MAG: PAS-domain containing protein [Proteobacteria bacterium]|nr:PAS-domain containing protein [Pseudomonadota bacterium]